MSGHFPIEPTEVARGFIHYVQNDAQSGWFTASIGAKDSINIAFLYIEREIVNGVNSAEFFMKIMQR